MNKLFEILELMKLNDKVLIFDCFGVLVLRQPSSEHIFEYEWKKDLNLINFIREKKTQGSKIGILSNVAQYQFDQFFSKKEQEELFDFLVFSGEVGFLNLRKKFLRSLYIGQMYHRKIFIFLTILTRILKQQKRLV